MKKTLLFFLLITFSKLGFGQDATILMDPDDLKQEVVFGGDGKLTIKAWAEGNQDQIATRLFEDMNLKIFRVPIFALQPITDTIYLQMIDVIKSVQSINPDVKIFASIANGDGYGVNHHGTHKFPASMTGCCPSNVYSLNLTAYASYLDSFMNLMSENNIVIDYFGPFNEDPADNSDFQKVFSQMNNLGSAQKVGLERWGLQTSINQVIEQEEQIDIAGSHFYDDETLTDWDGKWTELVNTTSLPVWYTESTRYTTTDGVDKLIAGMNNIYPAINGGSEAIIFYQAVKRFVWANGGISGQYKYKGFQNIVNTSKDKNVIPVNVVGNDMRSTAFYDGEKIGLHVTNTSSSDQTTSLELLSNYKVYGEVSRTIWTENVISSSNYFTLNGNSKWNVTIPANSYVYFEIPATNIVTLINEANHEKHTKLYPNPCTDQLYINAPDSSFELFNFMGEKIDIKYTVNNNQLILNTDELQSGVYIITIENKTMKFIKE